MLPTMGKLDTETGGIAAGMRMAWLNIPPDRRLVEKTPVLESPASLSSSGVGIKAIATDVGCSPPLARERLRDNMPGPVPELMMVDPSS